MVSLTTWIPSSSDYVTQTFSPESECIDLYRINDDSLMHAALPWICIGIALFGLFVNAVSIVIFTRKKSLIGQKPRLLIINQSVCDLIFCAFLLCYWLTKYYRISVPDNVAGSILCTMWMGEYFIWALVIVSTVNLQATTIERFLAIMFPIWKRQRNGVLWGIAGVWFLGFASNFYGVYDMERGTGLQATCCIIGQTVPIRLHQILGTFTVVLLYPFPLVTIAVSYPAMICSLRRSSSGSSTAEKRKIRASWTLLRTLTIACLAYLVLNLSHLFYFFELINVEVVFNDRQGVWRDLMIMLVNMNMIVNPVIYAAFMPAFRKELHNLFLRHSSGSLAADSGQNAETATTSF